MAEKIQQWVLLVNPIPHLRVLQRESYKLHVEDDKLLQWGTKQNAIDIKEGKENPIRPNHHLNRKKAMAKRLDYKTALQWEAKRIGFTVPRIGAYIKFYIAMPKSWSNKKRNALAWQPHEQTPDVDNLLKIFFDALVKKDQVLSDYRASKFWSPTPKGFIAVTLGELQPAVGYMKTNWERILI